MEYANGPGPANDGWLGRIRHELRLLMAAQGVPALRRQAPSSRLETHPTAHPLLHPSAHLPAAGAEPPLGRARVLVVDDNPAILMVTSEMLSQWGIMPFMAGDGAEAVVLTLEFPLDLVLMDLQMPGVDGFEATDQIRRLERDRGQARVPIVAHTASTQVDEPMLQACGFDGLLRKPCDAATLDECLQRWCAPAGHWIVEASAGLAGPAAPARPPHFGAAIGPA